MYQMFMKDIFKNRKEGRNNLNYQNINDKGGGIDQNGRTQPYWLFDKDYNLML